MRSKQPNQNSEKKVIQEVKIPIRRSRSAVVLRRKEKKVKGSNSKGTTECNRQQQQQQQQRHRRKVENNRFSFKFPSKGLQEIARSRKKLVIERSLLHPTTGLYVRSQCMCVSVGKRFFRFRSRRRVFQQFMRVLKNALVSSYH